MAKLVVLPEQAIISGFKGTIDFYVHDGVPCARKWPRPPSAKRAPAVQAQWPDFIYISKMWLEIPQEMRDAYREMAVGSGLSGRDMFIRSYLSGLYRYPMP